MSNDASIKLIMLLGNTLNMMEQNNFTNFSCVDGKLHFTKKGHQTYVFDPAGDIYPLVPDTFGN